MHDYIISQLAADRRRALQSEADAYRVARTTAKVKVARGARGGRSRHGWFSRAVAHN